MWYQPHFGKSAKVYGMQSVHMYDFDEARRILGGKEPYPACYTGGHPCNWQGVPPDSHKTCDGMQILAFHPEMEWTLAKTSNTVELSLIYKGFLQLGLLLNRTVVWPDLPCNATSYINKRPVLSPGDAKFSEQLDPPIDVNRPFYPWGDFKCQWSLVSDNPACQNKRRSLVVWEFEDWVKRLGSGERWQPKDGENVVVVTEGSRASFQEFHDFPGGQGGAVLFNVDEWRGDSSNSNDSKLHGQLSPIGTYNSSIINSTVINSHISNSTITNSTIRHSMIRGSNVRESVIINEVMNGEVAVVGHHSFAVKKRHSHHRAAVGIAPGRTHVALGARRRLRAAEVLGTAGDLEQSAGHGARRRLQTADVRGIAGPEFRQGAGHGASQRLQTADVRGITGREFRQGAGHGAQSLAPGQQPAAVSAPATDDDLAVRAVPTAVQHDRSRRHAAVSDVDAASHAMKVVHRHRHRRSRSLLEAPIKKMDVWRSASALRAADIVAFKEQHEQALASQPVLYIKSIVNVTDWGVEGVSEAVQAQVAKALKRYNSALRSDCKAFHEEEVVKMENEQKWDLKVEDGKDIVLQSQGHLQLVEAE
jgi:hypothetical protein